MPLPKLTEFFKDNESSFMSDFDDIVFNPSDEDNEGPYLHILHAMTFMSLYLEDNPEFTFKRYLNSKYYQNFQVFTA